MTDIEAHRRALVGLGYRMLGTLSDAEDVAQEALLRLHRADPAPDDERAWLVRVASRLCIDRLREARTRRESYVGPWLPDFVVSDADPAEDVVRQESVSLALLVVLESLSGAERAAFVLHDAFGYGYEDLAAMLDRSEQACRQLVSRARRAVQARRPRYETDRARRAEVAYEFMAAAGTGDVERLMAVLADDVVLRSDAGGRRPSPRRPLYGPRIVTKYLLGIGPNASRVDLVDVNGTPGLVVYVEDELDSVVGLDIGDDGRVAAVSLVREPDKVRRAVEHAGRW